MGKVKAYGDVVTCMFHLTGGGLAVLTDEEGGTLAFGSKVGRLALASIVAKAGVGCVLDGVYSKNCKEK